MNSVGKAVWNELIKKPILEMLSLKRLFLYSSDDVTEYKNLGIIKICGLKISI